MAHRVCPWWFGYVLASPLRRLIQDPATIVGPYVTEGMTVLEPGPGMGFFTLELARLVGPSGRVVAVDVQRQMIGGLIRRAHKAGLADRIDARVVSGGGLGVQDYRGKVDFVLAFAMVHEVPHPAGFLADVAESLRPGGKMLLAEPSGHVSAGDFAATLRLAETAGMKLESRPTIRRSQSAVLVR